MAINLAPSSYRECVEQVLSLKDRLTQFRQQQNYPINDVRSSMLANCAMTAMATTANLNLLAAVAERRITEQFFCDLLGIKGGEPHKWAKRMERDLRASFLVLYQFQIEHLFNSLLIELNGKGRGKYWELVRELVAPLPKADEKQLMLMLPAWLRNCLHSNGIHRKETVSHNVKGPIFDFKKDAVIQCLSWGYIVHALQASFDVVEEILLHSDIKSINGPIEERIVWEQTCA